MRGYFRIFDRRELAETPLTRIASQTREALSPQERGEVSKHSRVYRCGFG